MKERRLWRWRVDPDRSGLGWVLWACVGEAFRVANIGLVEHVLSLLDDLCGHAVMEHIRCQQGDSAVMVFMVIPGEESLAKGACVLDGAESVGELGPIFEGLELAFRIWIVIRDVSEVVSVGVSRVSRQRLRRASAKKNAGERIEMTKFTGSLHVLRFREIAITCLQPSPTEE